MLFLNLWGLILLNKFNHFRLSLVSTGDKGQVQQVATPADGCYPCTAARIARVHGTRPYVPYCMMAPCALGPTYSVHAGRKGQLKPVLRAGFCGSFYGDVNETQIHNFRC
nr:MAG TPA: hypothetical protein [Caudoviricetes sp.]